MLTKPIHGWSDFRLDGTSIYGLSYLNDIAFEWLSQAIHGLETLMPFCVKGYLEPNRFLCTVSYWNCHIVCEDDDRYPFDKEDVINEFSHTNMIQFCQYLYDDISQNIDEWAAFADYRKSDAAKKKEELAQKLKYLNELISKRTKYFDENHCFL